MRVKLDDEWITPTGFMCSHLVTCGTRTEFGRTVLDLMLAGFCLLFCCSVTQAQVVKLHVEGYSAGAAFQGDGTAVCVGTTDGGLGVYLTAAHNFRDATSARVQVAGQWYKVRDMLTHESADVATFESQPTEVLEIGEAEPIGKEARIPGYGPAYQGRNPSAFWGVVREPGVLDGEAGYHPIPGDSGAPVICNDRVVGIVSGYQVTQTLHRSDFAERRYPTRYVPLTQCREVLTQVYSRCGPGGCKIWIRPEVRQPIGFLGLPSGPPRVVNVAEPVPRVFVPEDSVEQLQPKPDPISTQGPQGPPGRDGKDGRSVTPQEVESIVAKWLDSNRDQLAKSAVDLSGLEARVSTLERRPFTLILAEDGKEVDRETYPANSPVIIDIRRFNKNGQ